MSHSDCSALPCPPQQLWQIGAVDMGQPRFREAKKSFGDGQVGSDMEENPCQDCVGNAQNTLVLFIAGVIGYSLQVRWDKVQPFPKCQCAGDVQRLHSHTCVSACVHVRVCVCVSGPPWGELGQGQQLTFPSHPHCSRVPLSGPSSLFSHWLPFIEPNLPCVRHCASPLACSPIQSDSQPPVLDK